MLQWNDTQKNNLRSMIANFITDEDKSGQLYRHGFSPTIMPNDMAFERMALEQALELCHSGLSPTLANLLPIMQNYYDDAEDRLNDLHSMKTVDESVEVYAMGFAEWSESERMHVAAERVLQHSQNNNLTNEDKYSRMVEELQEVAPHSSTFRTVATSNALDEWLEWQAENIAIQKSGGNIGPRLPWKNTWGVIPYMKYGEQTVIEAITGYGKTLIGCKIGEYIAHKMSGIDVLYVHLETDVITMMSRFISGRFLIPIKNAELGWWQDAQGKTNWLDFSDAQWKPKIGKLRSEIRDAETNNGRMWYHHANGATVNDIALEVRRRKMESERNGRRLVVIIDYFQDIQWINIYADIKSGEAHGLNQVAFRLKEMTENLGVHTIILAQGDPNTNYDNTRISTRGAKGGIIKSQLYIRMEREQAEADLPWIENNKQKVDALGNPIYYHREGELHSRTTLRVLKGNNHALAAMHVNFVNGFFRIHGNTP